MFTLIVVSAVVMGLSHTLAKERIFLPLRRRLGGKETWLGYMVSCPYCASHWIAFIVVPLTGAYFVRIPHDWGVFASLLTWFFSSILVTVVAAFLRIIFYLVDESQGLLRRRELTVDEEIAIARRMRERLEQQPPPPSAPRHQPPEPRH